MMRNLVSRAAVGFVFALVALPIAGCSKLLPKDPDPSQTPDGPRPIVERFTIDPNEAQDLSAQSGVGVSFGAGALVMPDGSAPSNTATVELARFLYEDGPLPSDMPGGFQGRNDEGKIVALASYGVMGIEITDSGGQPLNLGNGATAELTIPSVSPENPPSVPLWNYSESEGLWIEEGTATPQGEDFVANVSHFSLWNVDDECNAACIKGRVIAGCMTQEVPVLCSALTHACGSVPSGTQAGGSTVSNAANGNFTLTGLPSPAQVEVAITFEGETKYITVSIPESGDACIDLGEIAIGDCTSGTTTGTPPTTSGNMTVADSANTNDGVAEDTGASGVTSGGGDDGGGCDDPLGLTNGYWSDNGGYNSFTDYKFYCDGTWVRYYRVYEVGNSSCNGVVEENYEEGTWEIDNPTPGADNPLMVTLGGESATWTVYNTGNTIFTGPEANVQYSTLNRSELADPWLPNGGNNPTTAPRGQMPVGCNPPPNW